jgi:hypothetical protein
MVAKNKYHRPKPTSSSQQTETPQELNDFIKIEADATDMYSLEEINKEKQKQVLEIKRRFLPSVSDSMQGSQRDDASLKSTYQRMIQQ